MEVVSSRLRGVLRCNEVTQASPAMEVLLNSSESFFFLGGGGNWKCLTEASRRPSEVQGGCAGLLEASARHFWLAGRHSPPI